MMDIDDDVSPGLETTDFYNTFALDPNNWKSLLPTFEAQRARARMVMLWQHLDKLRTTKHRHRRCPRDLPRLHEREKWRRATQVD
jgi:hypothetical protein